MRSVHLGSPPCTSDDTFNVFPKELLCGRIGGNGIKPCSPNKRRRRVVEVMVVVVELEVLVVDIRYLPYTTLYSL